MNAWPAALPQRFEVDGYREGMGDGRLRSQNETGPAKVRRRFSAIPRPVTATMIMTDEQLAVFETFVRDTLAGGTLPFTVPRPVGRGQGTWIVQMAQNMPGWSPSPAPGEWRVEMDLVILP